MSTALFFQYNSQLGPPYQVLVDTNFINFAIKNKVHGVPCAASCQGAFRACSAGWSPPILTVSRL